jgi:hypothetical protein
MSDRLHLLWKSTRQYVHRYAGQACEFDFF